MTTSDNEAGRMRPALPNGRDQASLGHAAAAAAGGSAAAAAAVAAQPAHLLVAEGHPGAPAVRRDGFELGQQAAASLRLVVGQLGSWKTFRRQVDQPCHAGWAHPPLSRPFASKDKDTCNGKCICKQAMHACVPQHACMHTYAYLGDPLEVLCDEGQVGDPVLRVRHQLPVHARG